MRRHAPDPDPSKDGMTGERKGGTVTFLIALIWPRFVAKKTDRETDVWVKGLKWSTEEEEELTQSYLRDTSCSRAQAMTVPMRGICALVLTPPISEGIRSHFYAILTESTEMGFYRWVLGCVNPASWIPDRGAQVHAT